MRILGRVVLVLLALVVVGAGYLLLPAHLQIRGVAPELPDEQELRALLDVEGGPVRVSYLNTSTQDMGDRDLAHVVFLAEWENGNLFMIDAGMDAQNAIEFGELLAATGNGGEVVVHGDIAELLGPSVPRVRGVAFTHLHSDHTQGIEPFCAARGEGAALLQTSWQADMHNLHTEYGAELLEASCLDRGELEGARVLTSPDFPGLGLVALGGHTPGSTMFAIAEGERLWILSGDITNTKPDLETNTGKGFAYSYLMVPEDTGRTEELRLWLRALDGEDDMEVVVSHDLTDVRAHLPEFGTETSR